MNDFDFLEKEYDSFVNSISRFKWVILVTLLLSCSALLDFYSDHGTSSNQQESVINRKLFSESILEILKANKKQPDASFDIEKLAIEFDPCFHLENNDKTDCNSLIGNDRIKSMTKNISRYYSNKEKLTQLLNDVNKGQNNQNINKLVTELLADMSSYHDAIINGDNKLKNAITKKTVPLLNMEIENNDFLSILQIMLMLFVMALWLVLENLKFQVQNILNSFQKSSASEIEKLKTLIKSNFLFNVSQDSCLTLILQFVAIFFPFFAIFISTFSDLEPTWISFKSLIFDDGKDFNWGYGTHHSLILRYSIAFLSNTVIITFSIKSFATSKYIDKVVKI